MCAPTLAAGVRELELEPLILVRASRACPPGSGRSSRADSHCPVPCQRRGRSSDPLKHPRVAPARTHPDWELAHFPIRLGPVMVAKAGVELSLDRRRNKHLAPVAEAKRGIGWAFCAALPTARQQAWPRLSNDGYICRDPAPRCRLPPARSGRPQAFPGSALRRLRIQDRAADPLRMQVRRPARGRRKPAPGRAGCAGMAEQVLIRIP
jgi:hypothetical protein